MRVLTKRRSGLWIVVFTLVLAILPATAIGQDRGRWGRAHNFDKKCGKFINCHDARDGRRDRSRLRRGRIILANDRGFFRRGRHNDRDFDDNDFFRRGRNRDRDFDNDRFLRHRKGRHRDDD